MSDETMTDAARVDALLFEPLAGLKRARGVSAETHDKTLARLRGALAYMSDLNLAGMRDLIARHAATGIWPGEGLIRAWAFTLQIPPVCHNDYAKSLMRSEMGRRAVVEGWGVELFQIAKRIGPPPTRYVIGNLKGDAERNKRRVELVEDDLARGRAADPALVAWLDEYRRDRRAVDTILNEKGAAE